MFSADGKIGVEACVVFFATVSRPCASRRPNCTESGCGSATSRVEPLRPRPILALPYPPPLSVKSPVIILMSGLSLAVGRGTNQRFPLLSTRKAHVVSRLKLRIGPHEMFGRRRDGGLREGLAVRRHGLSFGAFQFTSAAMPAIDTTWRDH